MAHVKKNGKWGYSDKAGQLIIALQFDDAGEFDEGLAPVQIGYLWGYIDNLGKIVINPQFYDAGPFTDGLARARLYGDEELKDGFVDKAGKVVIQPTFNYANNFFNGIAEVGMGQNSCYIDKNGQLIKCGQLIWAESAKEASKPPSAQVPFERPPKVIKRAAAQYPELARRAGLEGKIWVKIWVDKKGEPRRVMVIKSSAEFDKEPVVVDGEIVKLAKTAGEIFELAAVEAARQMLFDPALRQGKAVAVWVAIPFQFRLK